MMPRTLYRFLFGTLRGRLILGVAAVHAVMMTLFIGDLTTRQRAMLLDRQVEETTALSEALSTSAAGWIAANDVSGLQELVEAQRRYPELLFAIITDEEGHVLADTDKSKQGLYMLDLPREAHQTLLSRTPALVDVAAPAMIQGHHVGWARVGIGQKSAGEKLAHITRSGIVYALAAIVIGSFIAWLMGRRITRRLYAVQETINRVRAGSGSARSLIAGTDEAAMMAREFNSMLDAVAERDAELRANEKKYRELIQKIQAAVVVHAADARILTGNLRAQQLLGLMEEQIMEKSATDLGWHFSREDGSVLPLEEYPANRVFRTGQPLRDAVFGVHRPAMEDVWVLVSADPVLDQQGQVTQVVVTFVDITARRKAEKDLALRNRINEIFLTFPGDEMYREVLQAVLEEMKSKHGVFAYIDETGAAVAPSLTRDVWEKCQVPDKSIVFPRKVWGNSIWGKGITEKRSIYANERLPVPEGHIPINRVLDVPILYQGEAIGYFLVGNKETDYDDRDKEKLEGIARSISAMLNARLQQERQLRQRERAEEEQARLRQHLQQAQKMEAIGQLAGGIAHDFNNILGIVNGYSEMILGNPEIGGTARRRVQEILKAGQRAASLTHQLLAFSRKQVLQPKVLSLNLVIEDIDKMLRRLIGEDIEVRTVLDPNLEAVKADPSQMEQVILNFCINARDAMPDGGRITVETANVDIDEMLAAQHFPMKPGRYVRLAVSDTGTGMDKETLSHIFEPFFTTKAPGKGTGLGLATVYGIVEQSGGHVWVYSEPGHGATFSVYLPAAIEQAEPRELEAKPLEIARGSETILLVEDAASLRALTRELLENSGYTVLEAEDGEQAVQIAKEYEGNISLLLTDVSLPKIKGPSLARSLLQQRPGLRVLYVSGYADNIIVPNGVLQPGAAFLQKPFTAGALAGKVRELLDRREENRRQSGIVV
jgi:PAS domain S-box-containing protein